MSTVSPQEFEQIRGKLDVVVARAKSDQSFRDQLTSDPEATLKSAGVPEVAIPDFMREEGLGGEVAGYARCMISCLFTSTCNLTVG
ncbi:MAG TPA: hypothetical protein VIJ28_14630 [Chloroflexota bacterium]|jgi:hypothetical protein|nr:hypothetical protein [Chloroflexota bacterium]